MALRLEVYARLRTTLLKCSEFDSHSSLQAVFMSSGLLAYRDDLPATSSRDMRVSETLNYLLPHRLTDGRSVLGAFLAALSDRYDKGSELYDELRKRLSEIERELDLARLIDIPFVVVAMTREEATALISEIVFDDPRVAPIERPRFRQFMETLHEVGIDDVLPHYGEHREGWRPYNYPQSTIQEIILDMTELINHQRSEMPSTSPIQPQFFSDVFFAEDRHVRLGTWKQLGRLGGVVIVDAMSMFHPVLRDILLRSGVGSNQRVAMLVLSPVSPSLIPVNQLIEQELGSQMQLAFARFSEDLDKLCEFDVGDLRTLQRRLFTIIPEVAEIVVPQRRPNPSNLQTVREMVGKPSGMGQLIFGLRGER